MSYDVAVWEGPAPRNDASATSEYMRRAEGAEDERPPTAAIQRFVAALPARHPDPTDLDDDVDDSPWADVPLISNAFGSFITISPEADPDRSVHGCHPKRCRSAETDRRDVPLAAPSCASDRRAKEP